jgi:GT2 family glycosyltransferase
LKTFRRYNGTNLKIFDSKNRYRNGFVSATKLDLHSDFAAHTIALNAKGISTMRNADSHPSGNSLAAIIIPHYNDVVRLQRCLAALSPQLTHAEATAESSVFEVVVVDNGSTVSLEDVKATYPQVRFVNEAEKGAAAARNRGVQDTTTPWIFFLDADCVPSDTWLAQAEQHARAQRPDVDIIGGRVDVFDETAPPRNGAQAFESVFAFDNRGYVERQGFSVTANLLTRREVFLDVGPLRSGVSEDMDWCHRARAKGYRLVYDDGLRCLHPTRSDWAALQRKWSRLTDEMFALNGQGMSARLRWAARGAAMLPSIILHTPKVLRSKSLNTVPERLRALATLSRLRLWRARRMLGQALTGH